MRPDLEHVEWQGLVNPGDHCIHHFVAGRILDRAFILPVAKSQPPVCIDLIRFAAGCDICIRIESKYKILLYKKRGT